VPGFRLDFAKILVVSYCRCVEVIDLVPNECRFGNEKYQTDELYDFEDNEDVEKPFPAQVVGNWTCNNRNALHGFQQKRVTKGKHTGLILLTR